MRPMTRPASGRSTSCVRGHRSLPPGPRGRLSKAKLPLAKVNPWHATGSRAKTDAVDALAATLEPRRTQVPSKTQRRLRTADVPGRADAPAHGHAQPPPTAGSTCSSATCASDCSAAGGPVHSGPPGQRASRKAAARSGAWQGRAFIRGGRARARRLLYMPAVAALRWNPDAEVYRRLRAKPGKVALSPSCAIIVLANTLVRQDRTWFVAPRATF